MSKVTVTEERYFPTLGILAQPGDEVDVPDEAFPAPVLDSAPAKVKKEVVVNDGSAPQ